MQCLNTVDWKYRHLEKKVFTGFCTKKPLTASVAGCGERVVHKYMQ